LSAAAGLVTIGTNTTLVIRWRSYMAAVHLPHPLRDHPGAARAAIDAFWALAIGVIAAYVFFAALGAFSPSDVLGVTIAVGILVALFVVRALMMRRAGPRHDKDPRLVHARERRGF
jgi:TRAP-type C4-dicarboxylate transport system permease large subunit